MDCVGVSMHTTHVHAAAQHAKVQSEGEYRSVGVVIIKHSLSLSHIMSLIARKQLNVIMTAQEMSEWFRASQHECTSPQT